MDVVKKLIGFEGDIYELSNKLTSLNYESLCEFSNWDDLLTKGSVVVKTTDYISYEDILLCFKVLSLNKDAELSVIKVLDFKEI